MFRKFHESMTFEKSKVSSARILHVEVIPSGNSFIYIKNKSGPSTDHCGTPVFLFHQLQV